MSNEKIFVSDLKDNQTVETVFMVAAKAVRETKNGDPYLAITLQDRTGSIEARAWDDALAMDARAEVDGFVAIRGRVSSYRGELQITISDLQQYDEEGLDLRDFMPHSQWNADDLFRILSDLVEVEIESEEIRRFLYALFSDDSWRERYQRAPAAVRNHHNYLAGLIEHSLSMARQAVALGRHYEAYYPGLVSTDLLIAGCIIHDMGKIEELNYGRSFEYSTQGQLVGHIPMGCEMVGKVAASMSPPLDAHLTMQLKHLILSHHGKMEYGSPVTPKSPEAILLHHLDMIDSRMNMCWNACQSLVEDPDGSEGWSDYQRTFNGSLYVRGDAARGWQEPTTGQSIGNGPGLDHGAIYSETEANRANSGTKKQPARDDSADNLTLFGD